ncbi:MAG: bifunctional phosphoribosyl-AMP cyclohydrolase/phosphoribosyl-ATP diphosphatase HisIE [Proteobacteria bacterium]|nr:bifunctional phosphoribosyl-AMP cyclohydrolase/phosphoribosyl-ATP diphosphatase HisIE [Pseudomonadota bacterium]
MIALDDLESLDFAKGGGLLPVVVQDADSREVLMLGYMNDLALRETLKRGRVVFHSRSRQMLWEKGETSGHGLELVAVRTDCDRDALLLLARPRGPTCHTGARSCFADPANNDGGEPVAPGAERAAEFLVELESLIAARLRDRPPGSYTAQLADAGLRRVAQKVGEEGVEVALAGAGGPESDLLGESADLVYHLLVLLQLRGITLESVCGELRRRSG